MQNLTFIHNTAILNVNFSIVYFPIDMFFLFTETLSWRALILFIVARMYLTWEPFKEISIPKVWIPFPKV